MLFTGLFINNNSLYMKFFQYISFFHYAYNTLMINEFDQKMFIFNPIGYPSQQIIGNVYLDQLYISNYNLNLILLLITPLLILFISYLLLKTRL